MVPYDTPTLVLVTWLLSLMHLSCIRLREEKRVSLVTNRSLRTLAPMCHSVEIFCMWCVLYLEAIRNGLSLMIRQCMWLVG